MSTSAPSQTSQIWAEVLKQVQQRIPQESFNTWFAHTTLEVFSAEEVTIGVASIFIKEWLYDHYQKTIQDVFVDLHHSRPAVVFRIAAKPFQELRKNQADTA